MIYDSHEHQVGSSTKYWASIVGNSDLSVLLALNATSAESPYISTDSGQTWTMRTSAGTGYTAASMSRVSGSGSIMLIGKYGGATNYLKKSTDYGVTWSDLTGMGLRSWYAVWMSKDGSIVLALDTAGNIIRSFDGGATSSSVFIYSTSQPVLCASEDGVHIIAYTANRIFASSNSGTTWTQITALGTIANGKNIRCSVDGQYVVFAIFGSTYPNLLVSQDYGYTWATVANLPFTVYVDNMSASSDAQTICIANNVGYNYVSTDFGQSWVRQDYLGSKAWNDCIISDDGTKFAGVVYNEYIYTGQEYPSLSLTSIDPNHGYLAGGTPLVITGTGFVPTTVIRIDGNALTNQIFYDSTKITGAAPAGASVGGKSVTAENP